jgi:hypothetical protein
MLWPPVCCCTCLQRTLRRYLVPANSCAGCQTVSTFGGRCFGRISCLAPVTSANSHCLPPSSCTNPGCCSEKNDWRLGRCGGTCVLALALFSFLARDCLCIVLFQAALREKKQSEHARKMESRQVCSLVAGCAAVQPVLYGLSGLWLVPVDTITLVAVVVQSHLRHRLSIPSGSSQSHLPCVQD